MLLLKLLADVFAIDVEVFHLTVDGHETQLSCTIRIPLPDPGWLLDVVAVLHIGHFITIVLVDFFF